MIKKMVVKGLPLHSISFYSPKNHYATYGFLMISDGRWRGRETLINLLKFTLILEAKFGDGLQL